MGALELTANALEFGYGALAFLVGIGILALAPGKRVNQTLSWMLIVDGMGIGGMASNIATGGWASPAWSAAAVDVFRLSWALIGPLYLLFTGYALRGGVARFLRSIGGKVALALLALALLWLAFTPLLEDEHQIAFAAPLIAFGLVGLVAAWQNFQQAVAPAERRQARAYLLAFAVRDAAYVVAYTYVVLRANLGTWSRFSTDSYIWLISLQVCWLAFLALLVYGVLSGQVLDLDRRVRTVASRTLALGFVAVVFVAITESVEKALNLSNPLVGIGAAVLLAFVFKPVEAGLERGARHILPDESVGVDDYRRAVDRALADGKVTPTEKRLLDDLTARLHVEREARAPIDPKTLQTFRSKPKAK